MTAFAYQINKIPLGKQPGVSRQHSQTLLMYDYM